MRAVQVYAADGYSTGELGKAGNGPMENSLWSCMASARCWRPTPVPSSTAGAGAAGQNAAVEIAGPEHMLLHNGGTHTAAAELADLLAGGLGIDIDEKLAARYPCNDEVVQWTQARLPDGSPARP